MEVQYKKQDGPLYIWGQAIQCSNNGAIQLFEISRQVIFQQN